MVLRHDDEERLGRSDHATDGMHGELLHHAVDRREQFLEFGLPFWFADSLSNETALVSNRSWAVCSSEIPTRTRDSSPRLPRAPPDLPQLTLAGKFLYFVDALFFGLKIVHLGRD